MSAWDNLKQISIVTCHPPIHPRTHAPIKTEQTGETWLQSKYLGDEQVLLVLQYPVLTINYFQRE